MHASRNLSLPRTPVIWVAMILAIVSLPLLAQAMSNDNAAGAGTGLVPEAVRTDTPRVLDGVVLDMEQLGNRIIVAGTFTQVEPQAGQAAVAQRYLFAYDLDTGAFDAAWNPQIDREVEQIVPDPDGSGLYVVGRFNNIDGVKRRKIARLDANGNLDTNFAANADSKATAVAISPDGNRLFVGGSFTSIRGVARAGLAELDPNSGAVKNGFTIGIAEGIGVGGSLGVKGLAVTPDNRTLVISASARTIGDQVRWGLATVDLSGGTATMNPWRTRLFEDNADRAGGQFWLRGFDLSPDGTYFVITTSGGDRPPTNDVAVRFPVSGGDFVEPAWITRNFDSTYAAAIDDDVVYIGGHFQYTEAPGAADPYPGDPDRSYGFGGDIDASVLGDQVIARRQVAALDPATGHSLGWNPGANGFNGVNSLRIIDRGLLLGHDGNIISDKEVGRHGFFDRNNGGDDGGGELILDTFIDSPLTGAQVTVDQTVTLSGRATAPEGISRVQVTVYDLTRRTWLRPDGTWGGWAGINASLAAGAGATESNWSLDIVLPEGGQYEIKAKTFDNARGKDPAQPSIRITANAPTADAKPNSLLAQVDIGDPGNVLTYRGTSTDDRGVNRVRVEIVNLDNGRYLQPDGTEGNYIAYDATVTTPGQTGVNWTYTATLPDGLWQATFIAIDTAGQRDDSPVRRTDRIALGDGEPISIDITSPDTLSYVPAGQGFRITGTAVDDVEVNRVEVMVRDEATLYGVQITGLAGENARYTPATLLNPNNASTGWRLDVPPLPAGRYLIRARMYDTAEQVLNATSIEVFVGDPSDTIPDGAITSPANNANVTADTLDVRGNAFDDRGIASVEVGLYYIDPANGQNNGWVRTDGSITRATEIWRDANLASPNATSTTWSLPVALPLEGRYYVYMRTFDTAGQANSARKQALITFTPGDGPPTIEIANFAQDAVVEPGSLAINGVIRDDVAVEQVRYILSRDFYWEGINTHGDNTFPQWLQGFVTQPGGVRSNFTITTPELEGGRWRIQIEGRDRNGQWSERERIDFTVQATGDTLPESTITAPQLYTSDFDSTTFTITGTATDDRGVDEVFIRVYHQTLRKWIAPDGTLSSEPGASNWPVSLANAGATNVSFSRQVTIPESGRVNIYVNAVDTAGQREDPHWGRNAGWIDVTLGDQKPTGTITSPATTPVTQQTLTVSGEISDDNKVSRAIIRALVNDDRTQGIRVDGTVGDWQWHTVFDITGRHTPDATFSHTFADAPAGTYLVQVVVYDDQNKGTWLQNRVITIP